MTKLTAQQALQRLQQGNADFVNSNAVGEAGALRRAETVNGQSPFAVVVGCADSRVMPERIFAAGLGEIFVVRVAGNVLDTAAMGSVQYALEHLGCPLVVVLGHEHCGAVHAAVCGGAEGYTKWITDQIAHAIGSEKDELAASVLNVKQGVAILQKAFPQTTVVGAMYMLQSGKVNFDV